MNDRAALPHEEADAAPPAGESPLPPLLNRERAMLAFNRRVLAQAALGLTTDVPLAPYALERFASGRRLSGRYGAGAVS